MSLAAFERALVTQGATDVLSADLTGDGRSALGLRIEFQLWNERSAHGIRRSPVFVGLQHGTARSVSDGGVSGGRCILRLTRL